MTDDDTTLTLDDQLAAQLEEAQLALEQIKRRRVWPWVVLAVIASLGIGMMVYQYESRIATWRDNDREQQVTLDRIRALYDQQAADLQQLQDDYDTLYDRCTRIPGCITDDVTDPDDVPEAEPLPDDLGSDAGPPPATGTPVGPTDAQVAAAVAAYCADGRCEGRAPSVDDVLAALDDSGMLDELTADAATAAVAAYCGDGDRCRGQRGSAGDAGATGATGPAGPAGPGPTTEQVAAAVAAYCAGDGSPCKGDPGATGDTGPAGVDAPVVVAIACELGSLVFTFSDGSSITVDGAACMPVG